MKLTNNKKGEWCNFFILHLIRKMKKDKNQLKLIIIVILATIVLDQVTKYIFLKNGQTVMLNDTEDSNNGYYIVMSIIVVLMMVRYISNDNSFIKIGTKVILGFGIAGAIGNLIDRIFRGYVVIFIKLSGSVNINLAYIYIIITWIGMSAILTRNSFRFLNDKKNKKVINDEYKKNKSK